MRKIDDLIARTIRPDVLAQHAYAVPDASGMVKLEAMENPYRLPHHLQQAMGEHLATVALNRYPVPSYRGLKDAICQHFGVPAGYDVLLGNGSDELISMLMTATAGSARAGARATTGTVLAPVPTFVMYAMSSQLAGLQFVGIDLLPDGDDFRLDLPAMLAAIAEHRPALVFLSYPNNPTGSLFAASDIEAIIKASPGLVVVDEAYQPFASSSFMARLPEFDNLIVMRTVSKLGLAGIRLGYMSAHPALLAQVDKVRPPYNINVLTEACASFVLQHKDVLDRQAAILCEQRSVLASDLRALGVEVFASQANFLLIRVPDAAQTFQKLQNAKILVKNVGKMHTLLANCLRVTVSTPEENQLLLYAMRQAL